jgi:hypothetical protein
MNAIHNFLCRLFFYVLILMFLNTAFGSWPDFSSPVPYLTHYGIPGGLYVALFEFGYRAATYGRGHKKPTINP